MFKIGDFSKLSMVSVKALRYYDELGLLKPAQVDAFTGYRYYSASQLSRLNRILVLKDLGLSLQQIAMLLDQDLTAEQIQGMLRLKQVELQQQVHEGQARLARIEAWLQTFAQDAAMPRYDVILKKVDAIRVIQAQEVVPVRGQIGSTLGQLFGQLFAHLQQHSAVPTGPGITVYYDSEFCEQNIHVGACLGFVGTIQESEAVKVVELPAVQTMASVIHHGSFSTLKQMYSAILRWIETNSYQMNGPNRELNCSS